MGPSRGPLAERDRRQRVRRIARFRLPVAGPAGQDQAAVQTDQVNDGAGGLLKEGIGRCGGPLDGDHGLEPARQTLQPRSIRIRQAGQGRRGPLARTSKATVLSATSGPLERAIWDSHPQRDRLRDRHERSRRIVLGSAHFDLDEGRSSPLSAGPGDSNSALSTSGLQRAAAGHRDQDPRAQVRQANPTLGQLFDLELLSGALIVLGSCVSGQ